MAASGMVIWCIIPALLVLSPVMAEPLEALITPANEWNVTDDDMDRFKLRTSKTK